MYNKYGWFKKQSKGRYKIGCFLLAVQDLGRRERGVGGGD